MQTLQLQMPLHFEYIQSFKMFSSFAISPYLYSFILYIYKKVTLEWKASEQQAAPLSQQ